MQPDGWRGVFVRQVSSNSADLYDACMAAVKTKPATEVAGHDAFSAQFA